MSLITVSSTTSGEAQTSSEHLLVLRRRPRAARPPSVDRGCARSYAWYGLNVGFVRQNAAGTISAPFSTVATQFRNSRSGGLRKDKNLQRGEQRFQIALGLINGRGRGRALEQEVNRFPRRAGGIFDGECHIPRNLHVLADESEIGRPLRNRAGSVGTCAWHPDVVRVRHIAGYADR